MTYPVLSNENYISFRIVAEHRVLYIVLSTVINLAVRLSRVHEKDNQLV